MSGLINRNVLDEDFLKCNRKNPCWTPQRVRTLIYRQKIIDLEPAIHSYWDAHHHKECGEYIQGHGYEVYEWDNYSCNYCGKQSPGNSKYNYCPNCGAKMDGITSRGQRANMACIDDWAGDILNEVSE